jgi:hypothetical protein
MQWQLILETTMHAFDINALLTMMVINKLTDRTRKNSTVMLLCTKGHNRILTNQNRAEKSLCTLKLP